MRLATVSLITGFALSHWSVSAVSIPGNSTVSSTVSSGPTPTRTSSLLISPAALPNLPTVQEASSSAAQVGLNLTDIQGDILIGMKKKKEMFFFFSITNPSVFKSKLHSEILKLITSTEQLLSVSSQPITAVNLAFSQTGLQALGVTDNLGDDDFAAGQFVDAEGLGDPGTGNWVQGFQGTGVHGVFLLASDTLVNVNLELGKIQSILGASITEVYRLQGAARPGDQEGYEHFGFLDGISQPAVKGFGTPLPGQFVLDPGLFLLGETGDQTSRPAWAKDGSFLAFRQYKQLVPEFDKFLSDNALSMPGLTQEENAELLGARIVGRWRSGAPVDLAPLHDDPVLAADSQRNNNFNFTHAGFDEATDQTHCPFSAHVRKTNPRSDFNPENTANHIIRAGIPYGPEVTLGETLSQKSDPILERGLAFVAYQSNIGNGFAFLQKKWVDNANFFFGKSTPPGVDPLIGSTNSGPPGNSPRPVSGLDPLNPNRTITIDIDFVISRGGEYFFSPSLSAMQNTLSA